MNFLNKRQTLKKKFTARQIEFTSFAICQVFLCSWKNRARFGNVWMYAVGSVSQGILLGKA